MVERSRVTFSCEIEIGDYNAPNAFLWMKSLLYFQYSNNLSKFLWKMTVMLKYFWNMVGDDLSDPTLRFGRTCSYLHSHSPIESPAEWGNCKKKLKLVQYFEKNYHSHWTRCTSSCRTSSRNSGRRRGTRWCRSCMWTWRCLAGCRCRGPRGSPPRSSDMSRQTTHWRCNEEYLQNGHWQQRL